MLQAFGLQNNWRNFILVSLKVGFKFYLFEKKMFKNGFRPISLFYAHQYCDPRYDWYICLQKLLFINFLSNVLFTCTIRALMYDRLLQLWGSLCCIQNFSRKMQVMGSFLRQYEKKKTRVTFTSESYFLNLF